MKLHLIECPPFRSPEPAYAPGDCWYARAGGPGEWFWWADHDRKFVESYDEFGGPEIAPEHRGKRPMVVVLPNGAVYSLLAPAYTDGKPGLCGWIVEGELPNITVRPSINFDPGGTRNWHGFITDGEMA